MKLTRLRAMAAVVAVAALTLTACSSSDSAESESTSSGSGASGTYPVTVDTKFGEVTIDEAPERIVALGWADAEVALALGAQPVGASDWLGFGGEGIGPWAEGAYDEAPTILGTLDLDYEAILALNPDLILDTRGSGEQERHDQLTQITPNVIGIPEGADGYLTTTEQQTTMIAQALGVPEKGEALLEELNTAFSDVADNHPDWAENTATVAALTGTEWAGYAAGDARADFLTQLGFTQTDRVTELAEAADNFYFPLSDENLVGLDADLVVGFPIQVEANAITDSPAWQRIPAVEDGRSIILSTNHANAISLGTTQSLIWAISEIEPQIVDALQ